MKVQESRYAEGEGVRVEIQRDDGAVIAILVVRACKAARRTRDFYDVRLDTREDKTLSSDSFTTRRHEAVAKVPRP